MYSLLCQTYIVPSRLLREFRQQSADSPSFLNKRRDYKQEHCDYERHNYKYEHGDYKYVQTSQLQVHTNAVSSPRANLGKCVRYTDGLLMVSSVALCSQILQNPTPLT